MPGGDERSRETSQLTSGEKRCERAPRLGKYGRTHLVRVLGRRELLPVTGTKYHRAAAIAEAQRGRVTRRQLLDGGVTDAMIETMLKRYHLLPLHRGVYAVGHTAPIQFDREIAALLACSLDSYLSHHSAAGLWGLRAADPSDPVHVTVLKDCARSRPGLRVHRTRRLDLQRDVRIHAGMPVTSPARTLLDLASHLTLRELERALDEALIRKLSRLSDVRELLGRSPGVRGTILLRDLVRDRSDTTVTHSVAEERFLELVRLAALPQPQMNVRLQGYTVDFFWPVHKLVVEVDGYQFHSTRSAFERDRRKDTVLHRAGIEVMRVTWSKIERDFYPVIVDVAQALTRRAPAV